MKDNQSYIKSTTRLIFCLFIYLTFCFTSVFSQNPYLKKVLYINSYSVTYSWSDSITSGVVKTFASRPDIQLYIEYLDANRFGTSNFENLYRLYKEKYKNISFDLVLASDNDALDFLNIYGEKLVPQVPVIFCGVNNIDDYALKDKPWYGFKEEIDQSLVLKTILDIIPTVKTLYFISDSTTTNQLVIRYTKQEIEPRFTDRAKFVYIYCDNMDSLLKRISGLEENSAITMLNFVRDSQGKPVNQELLFQKVLAVSKVPVFTGNEAFLGKGITGGVINRGSFHGKSMADLALKFLDIPGYKPVQRIYMPELHYYFDYDVLQKFDIDQELLPAGSVIINKPHSMLKKYLIYIILLVVFASLQALIIFYLIINVGRRRRAEQNVRLKYEEIEQQNKQLENANGLVNNMNARLEELNETLSETNEALVRAKQHAEEADKLKSSFLANVSHEIRTPLNAIIGFSTLSTDTSFPESKRNYFVQIAKSNSDQLLRLIDDILDLSKIESGQVQVLHEIFSVNDILIELITSAKHGLTNNKVDLRVGPYAMNNQLMLKSDPIRFKQIASNLLANAIKFTEEGYVEIGFTIENNKLVFYVKDTGVGINPENLSNIFERFWKTEGNDEKLFSGTGLGLAICKKFCELLGGSIWVESELNNGTTFYFTLSNVFYIRKPEPENTRSVFTYPEQNWENYTIVIAEDEESNLQYLKESLRKSGIRIYSFGDGTDIVDFFVNKPPHKIDVVLMDIKMPRMDGFVATKLIKEMYPDIPIIAQTAYAMVSDIKMIKESDFDDFVTKPIRPQVLLEKIAQFLEKK